LNPSSIKTLLADDHALVRAGLRDALASLSEIEIVGEVGNGRALFQAIAELRPNLLVMDVNMPDFEPVAAAHKIRAEHPELKILVVSAYDDQAYVVGLLSAGVNGYHLKDQPLADLQLAVRRILDGGRWISDPLVNRLVDHHAASTEAGNSLTRRQRELLYLLTQGYNNQKIALVMDLSIKTVENHLTALYRAIGVESRLEANNYASRHPDRMLIPGQDKTSNRAEAHPLETPAILLVDDNSRYRAQLGKLVGRIGPGAAIYEAEDGTEAVRLAVDRLREDRLKAGSLRLGIIRPFPLEGFRRAISNARHVIVIDRDISFGAEGIVAQEVKAGLFDRKEQVKITGFVAGVGGNDISANTIVALVRQAVSGNGEAVKAGTTYWAEVLP